MPNDLPESGDDRIAVERAVSGTPARIYRALIDPGQLDEWWPERGAPAHWEMDIRPGARWRAIVGDAREGRRTIHGEVLDCEPPRSFTCIWTETAEANREPVQSTVVYEVRPARSGSVVRVTQSGVRDARAHRALWMDALAALEKYLGSDAR